jgi:hypothetical protein
MEVRFERRYRPSLPRKFVMGLGRSLPVEENFIALKLMTVQPEADQPKAETGAYLRSDTN